MRTLAVTALLAMLTAGCARSVSRAELMRLESQGWADDVNAWWYIGSSGGYHYLHNTRMLMVRNVRIREDQLPLKRTFPLTLDERRWVRLPMGLCLPGSDVAKDFILDQQVQHTCPASGE